MSFFSVGFTGLLLTVTPPWAAEAATPTTIRATAIGSATVTKVSRAWPSRAVTFSTSGSSTTTPTCTNIRPTSSKALPTSIGSRKLAAAAPAHVPSSWVRGI